MRKTRVLVRSKQQNSPCSAPAHQEHRTDNNSTRKEVSKLSQPNHEFKYWTTAQGAFPPLPDQVSGSLPIAGGETVYTDADSNGVVTERRRTQVPTSAWPTLNILDVSARTVPAKSQELSTQPNMGSRTVLDSYRDTRIHLPNTCNCPASTSSRTAPCPEMKPLAATDAGRRWREVQRSDIDTDAIWTNTPFFCLNRRANALPQFRRTCEARRSSKLPHVFGVPWRCAQGHGHGSDTNNACSSQITWCLPNRETK